MTPNNYGGGTYVPPSFIGNLMCGPQAPQQYPNMNGMGGYYTNNYAPINYFEYHKQLQAQKEREQKELQSQTNLMKKLVRNCSKALGQEVDDEYLSKYDPMPEVQVDSDEYRLNQGLAHSFYLHENLVEGNTYLQRDTERRQRMYAEERKRIPNNTSLYDFLEIAGGLYLESIINQAKEREKDVTRLYNSEQYQQLINLHNMQVNGPGYGNIDDMEIKLPPRLQQKNEYEARRQAFLAAVMNSNS